MPRTQLHHAFTHAKHHPVVTTTKNCFEHKKTEKTGIKSHRVVVITIVILNVKTYKMLCMFIRQLSRL